MTMRLRLLMVASENDGITECKVGGIADVLRDVAPALARRDCDVTVVTPSYGFLHRAHGAKFCASVSFAFGGEQTQTDVYVVPGRASVPGVTHFVIDHPRFLRIDRGRPQIYVSDPPETPFASDASKYALFCAAIAAACGQGAFGSLDCIHLHDWHASFLLILRKYHPGYHFLKAVRMVYTVHNLALQGVRPFAGSPSSLSAWFPEVPPASELADPRWPDCLNPMAVGVRLADAVHVVSPSYAEEVLQPSDPPGYYGGEGLEGALLIARQGGRLFGILNGCNYDSGPPLEQRLALQDLVAVLRNQILRWVAAQGVTPAHFIAQERLRQLAARSAGPTALLTSVTRVTDQKMFLLQATGRNGESGLAGILGSIAGRGVYVLLGTGDKQYEDFLTEMMARFEEFIFLNGYSDECANALYTSGDLFLMPSSFEPCGISQMLALRGGQPCLVHGVGGLRDTITDLENGFVFKGRTTAEQTDAFVRTCHRAIELKISSSIEWEKLCASAAASRFKWDDSVTRYLTDLYQVAAAADAS
jgi:starch synthase